MSAPLPPQRTRTSLRAIALLLAGVWLAAGAQAGQVAVAVAANFTAPMKKIATAFEADTGHQAQLSFGATGKFYAQITHGAPFDVLLSADATTPARLAREGKAVAGATFTYAVGTLVLWSAQAGYVDDKGQVLRQGTFKHLALANPKLAPYGAAAVQTLEKMGLTATLQPRSVLGENIAQTHQFISTGNAPLGFVALSQVMSEGKITHGSAWTVPADLHAPIRQDAALLTTAHNQPAALALMQYLRSDKARAIMAQFGYGF